MKELKQKISFHTGGSVGSRRPYDVYHVLNAGYANRVLSVWSTIQW